MGGNMQMPDQPDWAAMKEDDRAYRAEAEARQMELMNEMEDKRVAREQAEISRQERVRENEANALQALEADISEQSEAVQNMEDELDKDITIDFFNSLQQGQAGKRPE